MQFYKIIDFGLATFGAMSQHPVSFLNLHKIRGVIACNLGSIDIYVQLYRQVWQPNARWPRVECICNIQGLSYTRVALSSYLFLSIFHSFIAIITSSFIPFQVLILLWEKLYTLYHSSKNLFAIFLVSSNI